MALEIISSGPLTTVQDLGRTGYAAQGFQESGACDKYALKLANLLVGNPHESAGLEFTLKGGTIRFTAPEVIAHYGSGYGAGR